MHGRRNEPLAPWAPWWGTRPCCSSWWGLSPSCSRSAAAWGRSGRTRASCTRSQGHSVWCSRLSSPQGSSPSSLRPRSVRARVTELVHAAIQEYRGDHDLQNAIDYMQREFLCCGALSRMDWNRSRYFQCSADNPSPERCGVPYSCCVPIQGEVVMNTMCGYGAQLLPDGSGGGDGGGGIGGGGSGVVARAPVFTEGCLGRVERWVDSNLLLLLGLAFGLAVLQLIGISLACALIAYVKRLQQLQQQQLQQQHLQPQDMKLMMEQGDL
ncbi:tetraspanin-33-like isoform X2 [Lethenteron reissneri]|uniref:tetraspanin-33-like isoform X2 n=1 Tax=Lethenteron reissneri TaxID=7753 RepID=UPI002AB73C51|nr:tetraspanin-33-like isoform X2 [Lethenteron reissneri]